MVVIYKTLVVQVNLGGVKVWLNYDGVHLYIATSQSGIEGQGNTCRYNRTGSYKNLIGHTGIPLGNDTTPSIGLELIRISVQLEL